MKKIYEFYWDCGRQGSVEGVFIEDSELVDMCIGKSVYFGEILGKHSEVYGTLDSSDLKVLTDDQEFVAMFQKILGSSWQSGYNPIDTIIERVEDDEDEEDEDTEDFHAKLKEMGRI